MFVVKMSNWYFDITDVGIYMYRGDDSIIGELLMMFYILMNRIVRRNYWEYVVTGRSVIFIWLLERRYLTVG